jgi:hypothetical protein
MIEQGKWFNSREVGIENKKRGGSRRRGSGLQNGNRVGSSSREQSITGEQRKRSR